ncbi:hypothetical protein K7G98_43205, partial [Saccharothrix sp. MB29]|nr:hypothetical protein [Saccharothrix sp. MB29]
GRPDAAFLARRTRTRRLCYLSNVDADTVLSAEVSSSLTGSPGGLTDEVVDVVLRDRENGAVVNPGGEARTRPRLLPGA